MQSTVTQQDINIFSTDPTGVKEQPQGTNYTNGVEVGYTAPAKWWNWFWNKITSFLTHSKADRNSMLAEMQGVLSAASMTADPYKYSQLSEAVNNVVDSVIEDYDNETVAEEIGGVMVTHAKNKPYVVGYTVFYPDTELL
jgi:hypothetical protein